MRILTAALMCCLTACSKAPIVHAVSTTPWYEMAAGQQAYLKGDLVDHPGKTMVCDTLDEYLDGAQWTKCGLRSSASRVRIIGWHVAAFVDTNGDKNDHIGSHADPIVEIEMKDAPAGNRGFVEFTNLRPIIPPNTIFHAVSNSFWMNSRADEAPTTAQTISDAKGVVVLSQAADDRVASILVRVIGGHHNGLRGYVTNDNDIWSGTKAHRHWADSFDPVTPDSPSP